MKFFSKSKDGGPNSTVTGYWLIEWKRFFSIVLLKFENGSRDEYHSHAFNSLNWILNGRVEEWWAQGFRVKNHFPSLKPILTKRSTFHRVFSFGTTWVFSIRGPWSKTWLEYNPKTDETIVLTHGRKII